MAKRPTIQNLFLSVWIVFPERAALMSENKDAKIKTNLAVFSRRVLRIADANVDELQLLLLRRPFEQLQGSCRSSEVSSGDANLANGCSSSHSSLSPKAVDRVQRSVAPVCKGQKCPKCGGEEVREEQSGCVDANMDAFV